MYRLFYYPRNASWAPHMLLAEMQLDYELILVDRKTEAQKDPDYLKLNPTDRIPNLSTGTHVIKITRQVKQLKTLIIILGLCFSGWTNAEFYKCAAPDGSIKFSDQPCSLGKATLPSEPVSSQKNNAPTPSANTLSKSSENTLSNLPARKDLPKQDRYTPEEIAQRNKAAMGRLDATHLEQEARCEKGDGGACCFGVNLGKGKSEHFKSCAKHNNYAFGDYWLVNNADSIYEKRKKDLEQAAAAKRIPMSEIFDIKMHIFCFRHKIEGTDQVEGHYYPFSERVFFKEESGRPVLNRIFLRLHPNSKKNPPSGDEFSNLDQLAQKVCPQ